MGTQDKSTPIGLKEILDAIRAKFDDITGTVGIANKVRLDAKVLIAISGVRPQDVDDELLLRSRHFVDDLQRSLDLVDLVEAEEGASNTTMQADDPIVNHGGQG